MISPVRYLFIFQGGEDNQPLRKELSRQLKELDNGVEYDFYVAADAEDVLRHVSLYCDLHKDLDTCFVACGDDALTSGVAAGLMGAGEGKTLAVFDPEGSRSLPRNYEGAPFGSVAAIMAGAVMPLDMIRVNNTYAVNACTFGIDSPDGSADSGYIPTLSAVLRRSLRSVKISADGIPLDSGAVFAFALAGGRYAPGGRFCAPQARNDDGQIDLCIVKNQAPARLLKVLSALASGAYADEPAFAGDLILRRAKSLEIESPKDIVLSVDGRPLSGRQFKVRIIPGAIRMVVPAERG